MLREGPIPRVVHGLLEYVLGIFLVAAPFLVGYDDVGVALGTSIAIGVVILVLAAVTEGPTGLVNQLPVTAHFAIDFLLAIFLIAAPFILGFGKESAPRNLFIALGVAHLLISIGTRFREQLGSDGGRPSSRSRAASSASPPSPTSPVTQRPAAAPSSARPSTGAPALRPPSDPTPAPRVPGPTDSRTVRHPGEGPTQPPASSR